MTGNSKRVDDDPLQLGELVPRPDTHDADDSSPVDDQPAIMALRLPYDVFVGNRLKWITEHDDLREVELEAGNCVLGAELPPPAQ
jgi:hypothetical protein